MIETKKKIGEKYFRLMNYTLMKYARKELGFEAYNEYEPWIIRFDYLKEYHIQIGRELKYGK